ncbi:MAG: response regulator transcription factor [Clostridiales bacterium]|nr:response regulator transcription factor [Clostridiales bacterium]
MDLKEKVLIIDDDKNICELVSLYLLKEGYEVIIAFDGREGLEKFESDHPDIIILDIMMPGMDGWEVCRTIKKKYTTPILMLSAKGETFDKVLGLELGADDYIVKPFDPKELVARVKAVLRRSLGTRENPNEIVLPDLLVNKDNYSVILKGEAIDMPPKEFLLLYQFVSNPNTVFTRENLLHSIWGYDFYGDSRTVDVHIKRLREKINIGNPIWELKTVWGIGYKFEVNQ